MCVGERERERGGGGKKQHPGWLMCIQENAFENVAWKMGSVC